MKKLVHDISTGHLARHVPSEGASHLLLTAIAGDAARYWTWTGERVWQGLNVVGWSGNGAWGAWEDISRSRTYRVFAQSVSGGGSEWHACEVRMSLHHVPAGAVLSQLRLYHDDLSNDAEPRAVRAFSEKGGR